MTVDQKTDDKIEDMSGSSPALSPELTAEELAEIERKFDPETAFRATPRLVFSLQPFLWPCPFIISMLLVLV